MDPSFMPIFDGHNDALSRAWCGGSDPLAAFRNGRGHVTVEKANAGGLGGGFFALYAPAARAAYDFVHMSAGNFEAPLPPMLPQEKALAAVMAQVGILRHWEDAGLIRTVTTGDALDGPGLRAILHMEGADAIDPDLFVLEALYAQGLRSLGPVWSRSTIFGHGVPFAYGRDGDTGPGLTEAGQRLLARCKTLGIMIDTSHLTMKGFWDVAEAGFPLVATHSNAYGLCPVTRNLTDAQLRAIGETKGMVGANFATLFLSEEGWRSGRAGIPDVIDQLRYMVTLAGEDHVGLGSDFDGAPLPQGLTSAADLQRLVAAMEEAGFGADLITKLCHKNWHRFLQRQFSAQKGA